jgi:small-conductance mechanosensitive channel
MEAVDSSQFWHFFRATMAVLVLGVFGLTAPPCVAGQEATEATQPSVTEADLERESPLAPVEVDGNPLFTVRGVSAFPADQRAAAIAGRIKAVAADPNFSPTDVRAVEHELGTAIFAGNHRLMVVFDADSEIASVPRKALADLIVSKIQNAIVEYRNARSSRTLSRSAALAGAATVSLAILVMLIIWSSRRLHRMLESRYRERLHAVGIQSFQVVRAEQIWNALRRLIGGGRVILILAIVVVYLQYVLALFPWTRPTAYRLRGYILGPLETMGRGFVNHIPSLLFLVILFFVTRFALKLIHRFFDALKSGEVSLSAFDPEWSESTYKLIRLGVVVLALVVAYPYIPGGRSEAFKGITIFIGLVFSLGSSSAIANIIAGYSMTYRRAFRVGDRVKIGETMGDVTKLRLQATHLKTVKNEEVIIPNSSIINNEVVNYSSLAREGGLILHTTVGIGYGTPWRQVEALLIMAAERTPRIMKEPSPFIRQKALGDFAVTYEINVYCDDPQAMGLVYTMLHRNILDLFNEYGVQIMTPAYEGDPEGPKVVPKEEWFSAPARVAELARGT